MADRTIPIKLSGREITAQLPPSLRPAARSAGEPPDPFLPPGYLRPTKTFDVSPSARSGADGVSEQRHDARADEVVVLELADGSTFITSAQRLRDSLAQSHPEMLDGDEILLEALRLEGAGARGDLGQAVGGLVSKVFSFVAGEVPDPIIEAARERLGSAAGLGVTWAGTKALMWAIEERLDRKPGLYRWTGATGSAADFKPEDLRAAPPGPDRPKPMLVFIHGTGSNTQGSFGDLRAGDRDLWVALDRKFSIYAFEHKTMSESPITNALELAAALPDGANVSLVSHSRGGLVADLLCLRDFDGLIADYKHAYPGTGDADAEEAARVRNQLGEAHAEHRADLTKLAGLLRDRRLVIQRYVRAASPARGTLLASGNLDLFLSGLLTLIGQVPAFFGNPVYSAFKRVVIEIAKNRTNPHLVPGIEAMLPDSPMARLLRDAPVKAGIDMAILAGDIQGGNLLKRLGVLLTDFILFENVDNDLVVDTPAMLAGIAPHAGSRVLFDRGAGVSHFRYFSNHDTRRALRDWLVAEDPRQVQVFRPLPSRYEDLRPLVPSVRRDALRADLPVVVVLPGIMGSHLRAGGKDRVWFDPAGLAIGGLARIGWDKKGIEAEDLFRQLYGRLCEQLSESHRVEPFPYDWRQPLDVLAERLGEFLDRLLKETDKPIRLLAHSMGGLVVRGCIHRRRAVMDQLMARDGARFVMLGTPNQGAHSMVENLIGKGGTLRALAGLDVAHDLQDVLDIVAGFRGALQLLPRPGFTDTFQGQADGGGVYAFQKAQTWAEFKDKVRDLWFGNGRVGTPSQAVLDAGSWLWTAEGADRLPPEYEKKTAYVFGIARNTPCGVREEGGRLKMVGTSLGDGTVTWASGRIGGIGQFYYLPAEHGDLAAAREHFPALVDLLTSGATSGLSKEPPATRAVEQPRPVAYDAGPPTADDPETIELELMGASLRNRVPPPARRRLEVAVKAMDLRFLSKPIMVGQYEQDPIAGPQALIDRELLEGDLRERHSLGLYAGPRGTATVVLRVPNELERQRGSLSGAVVTGMGPYDGTLSMASLTEAVRTGVLRYLLQVVDVLGKADQEVTLATLLLGYNSSANLSIAASVEALVSGVIEANERFHETTRLNIHVGQLDIVELYRDTAITAVYELRQMAGRLALTAERQGAQLVVREELEQGEGVRERLFDNRSQSYWPRLSVTDADRSDDLCPPECFEPRCPAECYDDPCECKEQADGKGEAGGPNGPPRPGARTRLADRLRFLYIGQRARAESVAQQRQPGLIEALVRQQIHNPAWQEDIGRMLFQLMVPHDFKDAARQLDRVVLVVDSYTANLPWELMMADDPTRSQEDRRPLALRTAVVRQLTASRFRARVRQAMDRTALVIGNPSVEGFTIAFPGPKSRPAQPPPDLPNAKAEAEAVAGVLRSAGYTVTPLLEGSKAIDVMGKLYAQPYRVLHISAHGVFDIRHVEGRRRSGVLLSDGLLITAAEVEAMETVPELVFLNCCHLGQVDDPTVRGGNKLAASIARELIQIGVRCVVVAGWAVNDAWARVFGEAFYEHLLLRRRPFGDAVFAARKAVWEANRTDVTWGAFQAYGDPGWLAEPRADDGGGAGRDGFYASPDELLDELARIRADFSRKRDRQGDRELQTQVDTVRRIIESRCPPAWPAMPEVQSALAATWRDLGRFEDARDAYRSAIQAEDKAGRVPIKDIEQLADIEARLGEQREARRRAAAAGAAEAPPGEQEESPESLIDLAISRLETLDHLVSAQAHAAAGDPAGMPVNAERSALRGGAFKRKASLYAQRVLAREQPAPEKGDAERLKMLEALEASAEAYRRAEASPGDHRFRPYNALNRLALKALLPWETPADRGAAIALAQHCRLAAAQSYARRPNVWDAAMQAEAVLVEHLIDGSLGRTGDGGQSAFEEVVRAYEHAMSNVTIKPSQLDSLLSQMETLSTFYDALSVDAGERSKPLRRVADRLLELLQRLQPGRPPRRNRPTPSGGPAAASRRSAPATPAAPGSPPKRARAPRKPRKKP
jgi:hypothetical protein